MEDRAAGYPGRDSEHGLNKVLWRVIVRLATARGTSAESDARAGECWGKCQTGQIYTPGEKPCRRPEGQNSGKI